MMSYTLKGRRRFLADLETAKTECGHYEAQGVQIENIESGDEVGTFLCTLVESSGHHLTVLDFLISDPSEYPNAHTFFCSPQDEEQGSPAFLTEVTERIPDVGSKTIDEILLKVVASVSKKLIAKKAKLLRTPEYSDDEAEDKDADIDDDSEDDYDMYEEHFGDDYGPSSTSQRGELQVRYLQRDFNEVVVAGYRPGIIRIATTDLVISVSVPVITLAQDIAPRALMAWDGRLLSKTQHLTLLISGMHNIYPIWRSDGTLLGNSTKLQFRVGLTSGYKPSKEYVAELVRNFGLKEKLEPLKPDTNSAAYIYNEDDPDYDPYVVPPADPASEEEEEDTEDHPSHFHFSLSTSLEPLLQDRFLGAVQLRLKYGIRWAGAELLLGESVKRQMKPEDLVESMNQAVIEADEEEQNLNKSYRLPADHIIEREQLDHLNLPLLAFSYLLRRLTLCARHCLICYNKLATNIDTLKPYVCAEKLCSYQYYNLNRGPSLEYEICSKPTTVDLLVSLTYCAAAEGSTEGPFPIGMGLMVPSVIRTGGPLMEFDTLQPADMCKAMAELLNTIPPIVELKRYLEKKTTGAAKPKLHDYDPNILPATWLLLRWCVASCTAHLEELASEEDRIQNVEDQWRQFRFSVGAPDAEAKFATALKYAQVGDANARIYPSLYAFHGSPAKNWHSIIRHGLWFKTVANGRAHGDGVYFAKDGTVSMTHYARSTAARWSGTKLNVTSCVALAELVNLPSKFRSMNPYFVVTQTEWIICRYLLVNSLWSDDEPRYPRAEVNVPFVNLDPRHPLTISKKVIKIPEPSYKLEKLLTARRTDYVEEDFDEDDMGVFAGDDSKLLSHISDIQEHSHHESQSYDRGQAEVQEEEIDPWEHDPAWVEQCLQHILPPPTDAMPMATMALQKELKAVLKDQEAAKSLKQLGWYMPIEYIGDNLFQWIVELHSFEEELPIAQDMKRCRVNSLVFEIRFPPEFPHSPPFFRILKPRFLPFIQGGGGHVTGGGSMCMDLLTADGWLPSYSIPAILLQIKLAISNLDPRPARLAANWDSPYSMDEAIIGFKRAANTHGWKISPGIDRMRY